MKPLTAAVASIGLSLLSACVAPTGPVQVTRFHAPQAAALRSGTIMVVPAIGQDPQSLEFRTYAGAVARELNRVGYSEMMARGNASDRIATLELERDVLEPARKGSPVSVGVGGTTGNYGSGLGVGIGLDLSGPPPAVVETRMAVTIRDRASGLSLWEGRASFTARADSPLAQTQLGAAKMAEALFRDFPGQSGETVLVK